MKTYLSFFKLRFNIALQYKFAAIAGILTQFFWGAMRLMIYDAYYQIDIELPMQWTALVSYIWLGQAFLMLTRFNCADTDISESIITGNVAYEYTRPLSIYAMWYTKIMANKTASALLRFLPIILVAIILPSGYKLAAPVSFLAFILFILTLALGTFLTVGIAMLIYVIMFYTTSSKGVFNVYAVISEFLAGRIIPIPFMPAFLQRICYMLPFRLAFDLPYRLYVGEIPVIEGIQSIGIQIIWLAIIIFFGSYLISKTSKKLVVQGG